MTLLSRFRARARISSKGIQCVCSRRIQWIGSRGIKWIGVREIQCIRSRGIQCIRRRGIRSRRIQWICSRGIEWGYWAILAETSGSFTETSGSVAGTLVQVELSGLVLRKYCGFVQEGFSRFRWGYWALLAKISGSFAETSGSIADIQGYVATCGEQLGLQRAANAP